MWIQVRSMTGKQTTMVDGLSKLSKIKELKERLVKEFDAEPAQQRLFFAGKQVVQSLLKSQTTDLDLEVQIVDLRHLV